MNCLTLTTSYAESWRYNIMVTLAMLSEDGEQVGYHSADNSPLPIGSNCEEAPEGWVRRREIKLEFGECHKVRLYVYVLPNSLPATTTLAGEQTTFPLQLKLSNSSTEFLNEKWEVNRFGGCGREVVFTFE